MAVHARAAEEPVARRSHGVVVDCRWMPRANMAALAEHGKLSDEHAVVRGPVRVVTTDTALSTGRMFPEERAALFGVATDAGLTDPVARLQQLDVGGSMRIVATRAVQLALAYRHVCRPLHLQHLWPVALGARLALRRGAQLRRLGLWVVHAMTGDARHVARIVRAAGPLRVGTAVVAAHARRVGVPRCHRREPGDEGGIAAFRVRAPGP